MGCLGDGLFAVLINGRLTERAVWEKTGTLSETLCLAVESAAGRLQGFVGVYMFRACEDAFRYMFWKAEYALEMARQDGSHRYYVYVAEEDEEEARPAPLVSSHMLFSHMDEGVRILEGGAELRTVYVSPGFCRRLSLADDGAAREKIRVHPSDWEAYEKAVRETVLSGRPREGRYRVSGDGTDWILCSFRLLRIAAPENHEPIVLEISHNITALQQLKNRHDEDREWLRYVVGRTDCQLWEADLKTRTFRLLYTKNMLDGRQSVYENFPDSLVESGRVHRDSAARFREFAEGMFSGKADDSENFVVQYRQTSCYGWASMSYHMLYDEEGRPEKAIGIKEDLSYLPNRQPGAVQRRAMPADLYPNLYCYLQANLTRDRIERLQMEGRQESKSIRYQTYTDVVERGIVRAFSPGDSERLQRGFARKWLLEAFARGRSWFYDRCRMVGSEGKIQWISVGVNLSRDTETGDVCLFAYLRRENRRRKWEEGLKAAAAADPETGVYEAGSLQRLAQYLLEQGGKSLCALAAIRIGGAEELFGEDSRKIRDIVTALQVFLDTDCLVGKTEDKGRLLVFFPHAVSKDMLRRKLENAFSFARISLSGMPEMEYLRLVAGVVLEKDREPAFPAMARAADELCALHAGEAADAVFFAGEREDGCQDGMEMDGRQAAEMDARPLEPALAMTEEEKDAALACQGLMLRADSADLSINGVLGEIGRFYRADRVYVLTLTEQGQVMTMLNEWNAPGKCSIQQTVSGKRTEKFPAIARCAQHPAPMVLSRKESRQQEDADGRETPWQYAVFPLEKIGEAQRLLCIENPRKSLERTALLDYLLPYLARERSRFRSRQKHASSLERLYALPNLQAYSNVVYSLDSDKNSSLGVLTADIPDFEALKVQRGYEYGSRFLLRIAEVLGDVFGNARLFHTREAEFVVLCTDTTYEAFINQCARARRLIERKYAGEFRMGCTWSDGVFSARDLVAKARSLMQCVGSAETEWPEFIRKENPDAGAPEAGRLAMYLQPKIDMRTGALVGAEALARVLDDRGGLLPHGRIIEEMERKGAIQELDYFIFDAALRTMEDWREKGCPPIPVSTNFSRHTLLNPSALASVLAILSRYPGVAQDQTEIEITETAGDFENNTFADMIQRFGEYGLRFSLDDFGSSYSNMSMLANLPFHSVKLDRSLIQGITGNAVSRMMVRDMVKLCKKCGFVCIAEGVETKPQADVLLEAGCRYAQGYYYGRPMPVGEFEQRYFHKQYNEVGMS